MRLTLPAVRRRRGLIAAAVAVVAVLAAALLLGRTAGDDPGAVGPTAGPTADPAAGPVPTPSPTGGGEPTDLATADPGASPAEPEPAPRATGAAGELAAAVAEIEAGQRHLPPVPAGEIVAVPSGPTVSLDAVERVEAQASGPGEVAGPALALTVTVTNGAGGPLTLDDVVVNLYGQEGAPGSLFVSDPRMQPLTGELAPGDRATGTYVLSLPPTDDGQLIVSVAVGADVPTPLFTTVLEES